MTIERLDLAGMLVMCGGAIGFLATGDPILASLSAFFAVCFCGAWLAERAARRDTREALGETLDVLRAEGWDGKATQGRED